MKQTNTDVALPHCGSSADIVFSADLVKMSRMAKHTLFSRVRAVNKRKKDAALWYVMQVFTGTEEKIRSLCLKNINEPLLEDCFTPRFEK